MIAGGGSAAIAGMLLVCAAACLEVPSAIDPGEDPRSGDVVRLSFDGEEPFEYAPGMVGVPSKAGLVVLGFDGSGFDATDGAGGFLTLGDLGDAVARLK